VQGAHRAHDCRRRPARVQELIHYGINFCEREVPQSDGRRELDLGREGGHSKRRILHVKDITGRGIERALLEAASVQPNIEVFEDHLSIDLVTTRKLGLSGANRCVGPMCSKSDGNGESAVGGRRRSCNRRLREGLSVHHHPDIATGDGVAMLIGRGNSG